MQFLNGSNAYLFLIIVYIFPSLDVENRDKTWRIPSPELDQEM